jgi:hypothetical protein
MLGDRVMVFNATFINIAAISWQSVLLLVETGVPCVWLVETGVPCEYHRPAASHQKTLSLNVASSTPRHDRNLNPQL